MNKKLLAILLVFLPIIFSSCGSDEPDATTYTLSYNLDDESSVSVDITLFEYNNAGEKIGSNSITKITKGTTKTFTASPRAEKVKVYVKMYNESASVSKYSWVQNVFYLDEGKNTKITIEPSTMVGGSEP